LSASLYSPEYRLKCKPSRNWFSVFLFGWLLQMLIEELQDLGVDLGGIEFASAMSGSFNDSQCDRHLVFLQRLMQQVTLMHGDQRVF